MGSKNTWADIGIIGTIGIIAGVDVDLFRDVLYVRVWEDLSRGDLVEGEGLGLARTRPLASNGADSRSRPRLPLPGECSEYSGRLLSPDDATSMSLFSFARLPTPGDMMSLGEAAAVAIVSTGCATMIYSECPRGGVRAIEIQQDVQQEIRCCSCFPDWK